MDDDDKFNSNIASLFFGDAALAIHLHAPRRR
jgi:hypothetical protein